MRLHKSCRVLSRNRMEALTLIVAQVPNLAIAVWCIWNYQRTITTLLANQQILISQLMALHPPQAENHAE